LIVHLTGTPPQDYSVDIELAVSYSSKKGIPLAKPEY
jgi:hypothetical protein